MVDALWLSATWVERLRRELGLAGMHQVWGDRPAWYVWTGDAPGAYGLELLHAEGEGGLARGLLGIKYYPSPGDGLAGAFSAEERQTAAGVRFDKSGTPAFEARDRIPAHLFQVGALEIVGDLERAWCGFGLAALSACRRVGPDGGLLRRPPGWRLSHALFAKLLGLHAYASKHTPVLAAFSQEPGLELAPAPGGGEKARPCALNQAYGLGVLFGPDPGRPPLSREAWRELLPAVSERGHRWEKAFACRHYHPWEAAVDGRPVLNPQWWRLAQVGYTSALASACGCAHG